jgi:hypothetical protein
MGTTKSIKSSILASGPELQAVIFLYVILGENVNKSANT